MTKFLSNCLNLTEQFQKATTKVMYAEFAIFLHWSIMEIVNRAFLSGKQFDFCLRIIEKILTNFSCFFYFSLIDNAVGSLTDNAFDFILLHLDDSVENIN